MTVRAPVPHKKRVYVLGAGVSREVGGPLVSDFLNKVEHYSPRTQWGRIRDLLRAFKRRPNVERLLSLIDSHIDRGASLGGCDTVTLRKVRQDLVAGICIALEAIQFTFLEEHYGYSRQEDPYYYWARDFAALEGVKRTLSQVKNTQQLQWEAAKARARLKGSRDASDIGFTHRQAIHDSFNWRVDHPALPPLLVASLAGGHARFRDWICSYCPEYLLQGHAWLRVRPQPHHIVKKKIGELFRKLIGESVNAVPKDLKRRIAGFLSNPNLDEILLDRILPEASALLYQKVYPAIGRDRKWVRAQAEYLMSSRIDPYIVLIGRLHKRDTVIDFNYDLLAEVAFSMLDGVYTDYAIRDVIAITPWAEHGEPFADYDSLLREPPVLLKPHGSINWLRCPYCNRIFCTFETPATSRPIRFLFNDLSRFLWKEYRTYPCCHRFRSSALEVPIVPPTRQKGRQFAILSAVWEEALRRIAIADEIIFVGFSLSKTDQEFRRLITHALERRNAGKVDRCDFNDEYEYRLKLQLAQRPEQNSQGIAREQMHSMRLMREHVEPSRKPVVIRVVSPSDEAQSRYREFFSGIRNVQIAAPIEQTAAEYFKNEFLNTIR